MVDHTQRRKLFGVTVDLVDMDEAVSGCCDAIEGFRPTQHVVLNAGKVVLMRDDPSLARIVAECETVHADGMAVVWAGRLLGVPFPERIAGIDLMQRLLHRAEREAWPVFFLGAHPDVLTLFQDNVQQRFPGLKIAGARNGYFENDSEVALEIAASGARLLFVGMPSPRKERFLHEQRAALGNLFAMGVGGSFDVLAGKVRRAPGWMQRVGLEWLYRLLQEPGRLWRRYLVGNLRFVWIVLVCRFTGRLEIEKC